MIDPFEEFRRLQREMDKRFEAFFKTKPFEKTFSKLERAFNAFREPLSDIKEDKKDIVVTVELPGMDKKDIILQVTNDYVEVRAEKKAEAKVKKRGYFKQERSYKGFHRVIALPCEVKANETKAEYKNGVLKITVPRVKKRIVKKIKVK